MKNSKHWQSLGLFALTGFFICLSAIDSWAGPHLKFRNDKSLFNSLEGKMVIVAVVLLAVPFVLYGIFRRQIKVQRTQAVLARLAKQDSNFDWAKLQPFFSDVYAKINLAGAEVVTESPFKHCTDWYWKNDLEPKLNRWKAEGVVHHGKLDKMYRMDPVLVRHTGQTMAEGSLLVLDIKASVEDFQVSTRTGHSDGAVGFQDVHTLWSFKLTHGKWLLNNVETQEFLNVYTNLPNEK